MAKAVIVQFAEIDRRGDRGGIRAANGIDLVVEDRDFMVLVGPSGRGKPTTLRMIAGPEEITSGMIRIDKRGINDAPPQDRDIATACQCNALHRK